MRRRWFIPSLFINEGWPTKLRRDLNFIGEIFDSCLLLSLPLLLLIAAKGVNTDLQEAVFSFSFDIKALASINRELFWNSFISSNLKFT